MIRSPSGLSRFPYAPRRDRKSGTAGEGGKNFTGGSASRARPRSKRKTNP